MQKRKGHALNPELICEDGYVLLATASSLMSESLARSMWALPAERKDNPDHALQI
jgi:hypothetical protein